METDLQIIVKGIEQQARNEHWARRCRCPSSFNAADAPTLHSPLVIAKMVPRARVKCSISRAYPVESCYNRRLRHLSRLTLEEHAIIRTAGLMHPLPVYFVDNLITTGTTIAACRRALGWGAGLVYPDASKPWSPEAVWQVPELHEEQTETARSLTEWSVSLIS